MLKFYIGSNDYAKQKYLRAMASDNDFDDLNTVTLDVPTIEDIINACIMPPIMSDQKVVIVWSDKKLDWEAFEEFYSNIPLSTSLYMCIESLPKGKTMFRPMAKEFNPIKGDRELKVYLETATSTLGVEFASAVAQDTFFALAGQSEMDIDNWLGYLADLFPNQSIGVEDIRKNVPKVREITPYNILDYMAMGQVEYTLYLLENYIANNGDMMALANILIWKTRQWLMVYWAMNRQKIRRRQLAQMLGVKPYIAGKLDREVQKFEDTLPSYFLELGQSPLSLMYQGNLFLLKDIIYRMSYQCSLNNQP